MPDPKITAEQKLVGSGGLGSTADLSRADLAERLVEPVGFGVVRAVISWWKIQGGRVGSRRPTAI